MSDPLEKFDPMSFKVECQGRVHSVTLADGQLILDDHADDDFDVELALMVLGGKAPHIPCYTILRAWRHTWSRASVSMLGGMFGNITCGPPGSPAWQETMARVREWNLIQQAKLPYPLRQFLILRTAWQSVSSSAIDHDVTQLVLEAEHPSRDVVAKCVVGSMPSAAGWSDGLKTVVFAEVPPAWGKRAERYGALSKGRFIFDFHEPIRSARDGCRVVASFMEWERSKLGYEAATRTTYLEPLAVRETA